PQQDADLTALKGRVMEGLGRLAEALTFYRSAAESPERPVAVRAKLREIALRQSIGEMKRDEATVALESLTTSWRGDETEPAARRRDDPQARRPAGPGRPARPGRRAAAAPGRQSPAGRGALAGRGAARGDLPDGAQAGSCDPGAAREPQRRSPQRAAQPAPAD